MNIKELAVSELEKRKKKLLNEIPEIEKRKVKATKELDEIETIKKDIVEKSKKILNDIEKKKEEPESKELNLIVIKRLSKGRGLFNYLVGIPATKSWLDTNYITEVHKEKVLTLGHTFNTEKIYNPGDKVMISLENIWRHEKKNGVHYSIHKPKVQGNASNKLSGISEMEDIVNSAGISVKHCFIEGQEVLKSQELAEQQTQGNEGKELSVEKFPKRMQDNLKKSIGKWKPYVLQKHLRGKKSIHLDLRFKTDKMIEGVTLFSNSIDKLDKSIKGAIKIPQSNNWLNVEGRFEKGAPGATKDFPAYFAILSKGMYTIHEIDDHKIVFELRSDKGIVKKMKSSKGEEDYVHEFNKILPDNLTPLSGKYRLNITHIDENSLILLDKEE